jgi:dihydrodipicolinate synthase/N-acetylneuraminate lyase
MTPAEKMLLIGTGELSTRQTIEMCRRAHDVGADAAVVITPSTIRRSFTTNSTSPITFASPTVRQFRS